MDDKSHVMHALVGVPSRDRCRTMFVASGPRFSQYNRLVQWASTGIGRRFDTHRVREFRRDVRARTLSSVRLALRGVHRPSTSPGSPRQHSGETAHHGRFLELAHPSRPVVRVDRGA
jgi:hypothetical protein